MSNFIRTIELPLSPNYVRHWGVKEGVKELIQNAIDSISEFQYAFRGDTLTIGSPGMVLDAKTLILGTTTKADDDSSIGSFGEGYKIALVVLLREGLSIKIHNGDVDWVPEFRHSDTYGAEVLCIDEFARDLPSYSLEFEISGLGHSDTTDIYDSCLLMQPPIEDAINTTRGRILPSHRGKLYVGGLFVCDTDLDYGYDMLPQHITLERDRMTVDSWDLKTAVKEMWFSTQQWDRIASMMEEGVVDMSHAEYGCPELVKEACYKLFTSKHKGAVAVSSQKEMEAVVAKGMTNTVYASRPYYSAVTSHNAYQKEMGAKIRIAPPQEYLQAWAEQNQRMMSHPLRIAFKTLIKEAAKWSVK